MTQPPGTEPGQPDSPYGAPGYPPPGYGYPSGYGYPPPAPGYPPSGYPPGYPPPGQGYGYGYAYNPAGPPSEKPSSNIGWAIAAVLLFWPLSIPAFIYSSRVDTAWNAGDRAGAENASRSARLFGLIGVIAGLIGLLIAVIWIVAVVAFVSKNVDVFTTYAPQPLPT